MTRVYCKSIRDTVSCLSSTSHCFLQVYKLIFGSYQDDLNSLRVRRSVADPSLKDFAEEHLASSVTSDFLKSAIPKILPTLNSGFLMQLMGEPALMHDKKLIGFLLHLTDQSGGDFDYPESLSPQEIAELLKVWVHYVPMIQTKMWMVIIIW